MKCWTWTDMDRVTRNERRIYIIAALLAIMAVVGFIALVA